MKASVDIVHLGPQKTATTWLYQCFAEHPEVIVPNEDSVQYFSMFYHRGNDWFDTWFPRAAPEQRRLDPTPSYFRSPIAVERIYNENPKARLICCLRHPVERAFSHYWHEKKKNRFNFSFEECLSNFDLFTNWIEPSLYTIHLQRIWRFFSQDQVLVQIYDDLLEDPGTFAAAAFRFAGVDPDFRPSVLDRRVNAARPRPRTWWPGNAAKGRNNSPRAGRKARRMLQRLPGASETERLADIAPETKAALADLFAPEIDRLEVLLDRDLTHWRKINGAMHKSGVAA